MLYFRKACKSYIDWECGYFASTSDDYAEVFRTDKLVWKFQSAYGVQPLRNALNSSDIFYTGTIGNGRSSDGCFHGFAR